HFLLYEVSDKNTFLLAEHKTILLENDISYPNQSPSSITNLVEQGIARKERRISSRRDTYSWLSWNYADWRNLQE
ncbi:MAG: hypothetical protein AAFP82_17945, partial [Bacteroidota bacterium]